MSQPKKSEVTHSDTSLASRARTARDRAVRYAFSHAKADGHWCGEQLGNATMTSEYVFLRQSLGLDLIVDRDALCHWLISDQKPDGSWSLAPDYPGDVSLSVEAYLALKILGIAADDIHMVNARRFITAVGGVPKVRVFTRFYLAAFGLLPWASVPEMPVELILLPASFPINVYRLSSWARAIVVPLLLLRHHQPVFALPNGRHSNNDFLDELWIDPGQKSVPYCKPLKELYHTDFVSCCFAGIDKILRLVGGLRLWPLRGYARRQTVNWILDHQESTGEWGGGIFPAAHFGLLALHLEGFSTDSIPMARNLESIERLALKDKGGKRIQPCVGPVWDTILMCMGLIDSGVDTNNENLSRSIEWFKSRQLFGPEGDWRIFNPQRLSGAFSFEYVNAWYPDVDDTAAAIIAVMKRDRQQLNSTMVIAAAGWILSMQNRDGGWGAFDKDNDSLFLNKIPFSDMGALCDPSSADLAGRVLEAFGLMAESSAHTKFNFDLHMQIVSSGVRAIDYLSATQEQSGAWYGRWGCNYIYGTSNVLCGLASYYWGNQKVKDMVARAIKWLQYVQNEDGGWGEGLDTYIHPERAGCGESTPTQTAWALMALLAHLPKHTQSIERGIHYLTQSQTDIKGDEGTWPQRLYTGCGFPGHWYLGYALYSHYFPLMALGRYCQAEP